MKRWRRPARPRGAGYTITEVMIVLAVTGAMFAAVAVLLRGRQADAQFIQAVRDLESRIQIVVSDVRNGYYNNEGVGCNPASWTPDFSTPAESGTSTGCVFMGKAMSFLTEGDTDEIRITTIVGKQFKDGSNRLPPATLAEAGTAALPEFQTVTQSFGLKATSVRLIGDSNKTDRGSLAFLNDISGSGGSANAIRLYYVKNSASTGAVASAGVDSAFNTTANYEEITNGVMICVVGSNGKVGEITIGASGDQSSTNVWIREDNCA